MMDPATRYRLSLHGSGPTPERLSRIRYLLTDSGLGMDNDITLFAEARSGEQLVGCKRLAANVIKMRWRSTSSCAGESQRAAAGGSGKRRPPARGHFHLFLCTRPQNEERFSAAASGLSPAVAITRY